MLRVLARLKTVRVSQQGQSLVEFGVMSILLCFLLLGLMDVGRLYFTLLAMQDAAGEGASYGSVYPTWKTSSDHADPNNITYRVLHSAPTGGLVDWTTAGATVTAQTVSGNPPIGTPITVTVSYDYQLLTPVIAPLIGRDTVTVSAQAVALIATTNR
jgi:Flp pilus assembly protein TadG